ncbi:MAG: S41 family peptidase [Cyclobacteriaceae bacterium]|nr:S41 family peptidase [Cyclobacteriaceae bacterium]
MPSKPRYIVIIILLAGLIFSFTPPAERYFEITKNLDIFATLFKEVNKSYVDEVNPNTLIKTGIDAMLESLDPYTNYIPEDMIEDFRTVNTGQYGGIGAITREIGNRTVVTMVMGGYPAEKGGLKIGDEVLKIDNVDLTKISREAAGHLMKGEVGKPVRLTVKRYGVDQPFVLDFKRERIKINNVPYFGMVNETTGYIKLTEFTPEAGKNVKNALLKLKEQNARSIILDMRGNPGGLLMEAVNVCNVFIPRAKKVVITKGKIPEQNTSYETLDNPVDTEIPVAVLIDRGSASAAEIVAGTLQDYDRGIVLGERSFGKGLVQVTRPLSYNSQLKVTTAKYYTPSGRCIQVLDYTHRREDGSVASVPDSIKQAFKTTNGRTVYDGGGIEPDILVEQTELHPIVQTLYEHGFIFDYATRYANTHKAPENPRSFNFSEADYQQFVAWMKDQKYDYTSALEEKVISLQDLAKRERYFADLKPQLDHLKSVITDNRKKELFLYKDQIKMLLEADIMLRYFNERGTIESGFKYDTDLKRAIEVLANTPQYKKTLNLP